jgi:hypothetical protein
MNEKEHAIQAAIYEIGLWLEGNGNHGRYTSDIPNEHQWVLGRKYLEQRRGILFYSTGHGWRVRKKPYWKTVFRERFFEPSGIPTQDEVDKAFGI